MHHLHKLIYIQIMALDYTDTSICYQPPLNCEIEFYCIHGSLYFCPFHEHEYDRPHSFTGRNIFS